jgi:hypothetical protein
MIIATTELKTLLGITDNSQDAALDSYVGGLLAMFEDWCGLYFDEFGSNKTEVFTKQVMCNTTFNIGAWANITKVELGCLGSSNWVQMTEEVDFMFGRLRNHKQVIFEVEAINKFDSNAKVKITGDKGINTSDPAKLPPIVINLLAQCVQGYYNFQSNGGAVVEIEKSQNLSIKYENDPTKGGNLLATAQSLNPHQIQSLKGIFETYKVNYNYPL